MRQAQRLTLASNIGFTFNSLDRTLLCLGQTFENVNLYEIELYREIAINNFNNNNFKAPQKLISKTKEIQAVAVKKVQNKQLQKHQNAKASKCINAKASKRINAKLRKVQ